MKGGWLFLVAIAAVVCRFRGQAAPAKNDMPALCSMCPAGAAGMAFCRHPEDCTQYVVCMPLGAGQFYAQPHPCPSGRFWSSKFTACTDASNADCPWSPSVVKFDGYTSHGVTLSNNGKTATTWPEWQLNTGYAVSGNPMVPDTLYQVRVDSRHGDKTGAVLGVLTSSPASLDRDTNPLFSAHPDVLALGPYAVWGLGTIKERYKTEGPLYPSLENIQEGSTVGLALHGNGSSLHVYVNGTHQGLVRHNMPEPCHFTFFFHWQLVYKVTGQPLVQVEL